MFVCQFSPHFGVEFLDVFDLTTLDNRFAARNSSPVYGRRRMPTTEDGGLAKVCDGKPGSNDAMARPRSSPALQGESIVCPGQVKKTRGPLTIRVADCGGRSRRLRFWRLSFPTPEVCLASCRTRVTPSRPECPLLQTAGKDSPLVLFVPEDEDQRHIQIRRDTARVVTSGTWRRQASLNRSRCGQRRSADWADSGERHHLNMMPQLGSVTAVRRRPQS